MNSTWGSVLFSRSAGIAIWLFSAFVAVNAQGKVFFSQNEALELAFPDAEEVTSNTFILDEDQVARIESLAKCELDSKLVKIYTGIREGKVLGYALIDVHNVRTLPEAFMVVLSPTGQVRSLRVFTEWSEPRFRPVLRPVVFDEPSRSTKFCSTAGIDACAS
jgi:hypothetical protein